MVGRKADRLGDIESPGLALSTNGMNPFLCFNTVVFDPSSGISPHRVTGWAHFGLRKILRYQGLQLFMDATIKVVPDPFKQLFVVMAKDAATEMYLPIFHVLMTGKSTFLYRYALTSCLAVLGHDVDIASIVCDFEKALMQAIKSKKLFQLPGSPLLTCQVLLALELSFWVACFIGNKPIDGS
jgi:hypothetical protein